MGKRVSRVRAREREEGACCRIHRIVRIGGDDIVDQTQSKSLFWRMVFNGIDTQHAVFENLITFSSMVNPQYLRAVCLFIRIFCVSVRIQVRRRTVSC